MGQKKTETDIIYTLMGNCAINYAGKKYRLCPLDLSPTRVWRAAYNLQYEGIIAIVGNAEHTENKFRQYYAVARKDLDQAIADKMVRYHITLTADQTYHIKQTAI